MNFCAVTLFPEMIIAAADHSIMGRAIKSGKISISTVQIRDFAVNAYGQVDDAPYGGGAGMVLMPQPVYDACQHARSQLSNARLVYLTPKGITFDQRMASDFAKEPGLILLCGHYEGIDERAIEELAPLEVSIGDFVMTGGELGALVIMDAVARLIPGVLGNTASAANESFSAPGILEHPHYTRPATFMGRSVPDVLLSGHHANIERWRQERSEARNQRLEARS